MPFFFRPPNPPTRPRDWWVPSKPAAAGVTPPSRVQGNLNSAGSGSGLSVTLSAAVGSGNAIVGWFSWGTATNNVTSVTDNKGNNYTIARTVLDASNAQSVCYFYLGNITNAPTVITVNASPASFLQIGVDEYTNVIALANPTDGELAASTMTSFGLGTDSATSGSITTTTNNCLIYGVCVDTNNLAAVSAGTGYTSRQVSTAQVSTRVEDRVQTTAGSIAATFTVTSSPCRASPWVVALKPVPPPLVTSFRASNKNSFTSSSASLSVTNTINAGDCVVVVGQWNGSPQNPVLTTTGGTGSDTLSLIFGPVLAGNGSQKYAAWMLQSAGSGRTGITATWGGTAPTSGDLFCLSFYGLANPVVDGFANATGLGATISSGNTATLNTSDQFAVGYACTTGTITSSNSPWTSDGQATGTNSWAQHQILTSNAAVSSNFNNSGNSDSLCLTFRASPNPLFISSTATVFNNGTTPKTTASIAVQNGDLLVAHGFRENGTGVVAPVPSTASGSTSAWTLQKQSPAGANASQTVITTYTATATATGNITVQFAVTSGPFFGGIVKVWRNAAIGASAAADNSTGTGLPTVSVTTTAANSALDYASADWQASGAYWALTSNVRPVQVDLADQTTAGANACYYSGHVNDTGATGSKTMGMAQPTGQRYTNTVLEIKAVVSATAWAGSATFAGAGGFIADATFAPKTWQATATFNGAGSLTNFDPLTALKEQASATLAGAGGLVANPFNAKFSTSTFVGAGGLIDTVKQRMAVSARFDGAGSLIANPFNAKFSTATFAGTGSLFFAADEPDLIEQARATLAGAGGLIADAFVYRPITALFAGAGGLTANATAPGAITAIYTASPALNTDDVNPLINFRSYVQLSAASNGSLQVTFTASSVKALDVTSAFFGKWDGITPLNSTNGDMTQPGVRLTFSGSNSGTAPAGGTLTSDLISHPGLTLNAGDWVIVAWYCSAATAGNSGQRYSTGHTTAATQFNATGIDFSGDQFCSTHPTWATSGGQPGSGTGNNFSVGLVETVTTGATKWAGSARLDGAGGLIAAPTQLLAITATFNGAGGLTANAIKSAGTALFAGTGGFIATASQRLAITATFGGSGGLTADAIKSAGTATFAGAGGFNAVVAQTMQVSAAFVGTGGLTANPFNAKFSTATFNGAGGFTALVAQVGFPSMTFAGASGLTASPTQVMQASAVFAGAGLITGELNPPGVQTYPLTATLAGSGGLTVSSTQWMAAPATLAGAGGISATLTPKPPETFQLSATLAGTGGFSANVFIAKFVNATFAGVGGLTATPSQRMAVTLTFAGIGGLAADGLNIKPITATLAGAGGFTATVTAQQMAALATLNGSGNLTATLTQRMPVTALFGGVGGLTADLTPQTVPITVTFAGTGGLLASPGLRLQASALFGGSGTLVADLTPRQAQAIQISATLAGSGGLTANCFKAQFATATFAGSGSFTATVSLQLISATATFAGVGGLTATVSRQTMQTQAVLAGTGGLTATPGQVMLATARFAGVGRFVESRELEPPVIPPGASGAPAGGQFGAYTRKRRRPVYEPEPEEVVLPPYKPPALPKVRVPPPPRLVDPRQLPESMLDLQRQIFDAQDISDAERALDQYDQDLQDIEDIAEILAMLDDD